MPNANNSLASASGKDSSPGNLRLPERESRLKALVSNLRDFLSESPKTLPGDYTETFFSSTGFGAGVRDNLKEFFKAGPQGAIDSGLMTTWNASFSGFWQNLREFASPAKMPLVRDGEAVPEIWSKDAQFTRVQALSIAVHVAILALVIGPLLPRFAAPVGTKPNSEETAIDLSKYNLKMLSEAKGPTGGGSSHDKTPADRGRAPKFAAMQLAAPLSHPVMNPKIAMTPTVLGDPKITPPNVSALNWGNPLTAVLGNSLGDKGGNGIGNGPGNGIGGGDDYGMGKASHPAGYGGYGRPECLYCPNAQFSDEAVQAKYQGVVLVNALITPDGRATDIQVVKSLGLGLDENAVAAVRTWRFKPATGPDGKPAAVVQTIEVEFRLI
jgi:periplasmic protein TonB